METKEIIESLIKKGAKMHKGLGVKNVTVTPFEEHVRVTLSVDNAVPSFGQNAETGEYSETTTTLIYSSSFAIASVFKNMDSAAFAANQIIKNPDALSVILSGAKVDVVGEKVAAGEEYKNPFSTNNEARVFDHDLFIYYVTKIELSDFGKEMLRQLALNMMGIH